MSHIYRRITFSIVCDSPVVPETPFADCVSLAKQRAHLNSLISNLGAAHLLYSSVDLVSSVIDTTISNQKAFNTNQIKLPSAQWPPDDYRLLRQAQIYLEEALNNQLWRFAQGGSMVYSLSNIQKELLVSYGGLVAGNPAMTYMTGEKISALRLQIGKQAEDLGHHGNEAWLTDGDDFVEELITHAHKEVERLAMQKSDNETAKARGEAPRKRMKGELDSPSTRKAATDAYKKGNGRERKEYTYENLPITSDLPFVTLRSMSSTKVAYIVNSVLSHADEKFLVFSGGSSSGAQVSSNNLYYLAEALDLANIPHLIFVRTLSQDKLATYAKAFSESKFFRVLLLDIKVSKLCISISCAHFLRSQFAGRGLTLSSATRVIFTEPVWHKDEEAQAVKRAHRLGQDRPVKVETLVMKHSFEETVMKRGAQLSRRGDHRCQRTGL